MSYDLRIMCRMTFPNGAIFRVWDGSGPYIDDEGDVWRCCVLTEGTLDQIEHAMNGEAWTLELGISGVDKEAADIAWRETEDGDVIGGKVEILIQETSRHDNTPLGEPSVEFTGTIDDIQFADQASDDKIQSDIRIMVVNRFVLRVMTNGAVLSDIDQKARSAKLNPGAPPDRFCERIPLLKDKTINWPVWN